MSTKLIYTLTDEAPALATYSFLPIIRRFASPLGIDVELRDLSLAGRILAVFPEYLNDDQKVGDALAELGALTQDPSANMIKLPNISASLPQLQAAIAELQGKGYALPDYPADPSSDEENDIRSRYDKVKGSAVNPVLREGNSDRRAPAAVKAYAKSHPHRMGTWTQDSRTRVATMSEGDFRNSEQSVTLSEAASVNIEHVAADGSVTLLKEGLALQAGEILDASRMDREALLRFLSEQLTAAEQEDVLFSYHLKATMMKVSDPILFGHGLRAYLGELAAELEAEGYNLNNGLGEVMAKLPEGELRNKLGARLEQGPRLAMVNSDKGITNLHVPSDVIIDASMPAMIREGGKMWNAEGKTEDTLAVIPDSSYAGVYQAVIEHCREHGALDPVSLGSVQNIGLMAKKAEEYGSHDKTFEVEADGVIRVQQGENTLLEHSVKAGDIWRACQTKDASVRDWVQLALRRARATGFPTVFWLDESRAHDAELLKKVNEVLAAEDTEGLDLHVLAPTEACRFSLDCIVAGKDCISVTGNVLRDYLTDLFPILEVGTSAKMLSIVPLMAGGGLFETGAGGSAPKHVQQFVAENYLRWDSLGEFLALAVSLEQLAEQGAGAKAALLGKCLDEATGRLLEEDKSPTRRLGGIDNRGSHVYLALFWAEALAAQQEDAELAAQFAPLAQALREQEDQIVAELLAVQGSSVELGGYYSPNPELADVAMRPSATFNEILQK